MELYWLGLVVGLCSFLIVGLFHSIVIKREYYTGTRYWWVFLIVGLVAIAVSLFIESPFLLSIIGVFAFCCLWSKKEFYGQEERVKKGWLPHNLRKENI